jgi:hypothetical protein
MVDLHLVGLGTDTRFHLSWVGRLARGVLRLGLQRVCGGGTGPRTRTAR